MGFYVIRFKRVIGLYVELAEIYQVKSKKTKDLPLLIETFEVL